MSIYTRLLKKLETEKLHFSLLDPEKLTPEKAAELASELERLGTDAILLGGSTTGSIDEVARAVKAAVGLPIILFPNSALAVSEYADAVFFMSLMNSGKRKYIVGEPVKGAKTIKKSNIEPIGMGYIVINTGAPTSVEKVAAVQPLTQGEVVSTALAAEFFGMKLVYLEAGSGASRTVPSSIISAVKSEISVPLIVGGGINGPETTRTKLEAGADIIVTGTVIEKAYAKTAEIIDVIKKFKVEGKP